MQIEGDRPQGPHLLADGAYAGHPSRLSSTAPFPLSGKYLYRASFQWDLFGIGKFLLSEGMKSGSQISSKECIVLPIVTMPELCSFFQDNWVLSTRLIM